MTLRDLLDFTDANMRELKDQWVASNPDKSELAIYIYAWRGEELVACVQTPLDGNQAMQVAGMAAMGFNADVISISFESWVTPLENSPLTGKPWREGEMNFVARTYPDAFEKGWITEQLATIMYDREDNFLMSKHQFTTVGKSVDWGERAVTDEAVTKGGLRDPLQEMMSEPTMLERIAEAADTNILTELVLSSVVDEEIRLFHCDAATIRAMEEKGVASSVALFAEKGSERQKLIDERAEELGLQPDGEDLSFRPSDLFQKAVREDFYGKDE